MSNKTNTTENIIEILSKLQEFLRKPIIKNKLKDFYDLEEDEQREIISRVLDSIDNIDEKDLNNITSTWLEALSDMENVKINYIFKIYLEEIMKRSHSIKKISLIALNGISSLDPSNKTKLIYCFTEVLFLFHNRKHIMKKIPKNSKALIKIK
ncbi:MAG: hypothetical protein ACPKPY_10240 [Nitrososphaeraceae archaeon]